MKLSHLNLAINCSASAQWLVAMHEEMQSLSSQEHSMGTGEDVVREKACEL